MTIYHRDLTGADLHVPKSHDSTYHSVSYIPNSLFDANTILKADGDNTPEKLTVAEQRLIGRITGGDIAALTVAQIKTLLGAAAASGLATLDASSLLVQNLNASKISAGDIASARMSTNVIAAMTSGFPTLTCVIFDRGLIIKRDIDTDIIQIVSGTSPLKGAFIELHGSDRATTPGDSLCYIGSKSAGDNLDSEWRLLYQWDGSDKEIFTIDKSGNILTLARADAAGGVRIGTAQDANHIDDASHGAATATLYIGNKAITVAAFTAAHYYQLGDLDLEPGEFVKLIDRKIYRCTTKKDKAAIGIFWGVTDWKDSFETKLLIGKEIDDEYEDENDLEEIKKVDAIEKVPIIEEIETDEIEYELKDVDSGLKVRAKKKSKLVETGLYKDELKSDVSLNSQTGKFMRSKKKLRKKITNDLVRISDGKPAEMIDYAYSVAALGDSYAEHDKQSLLGAWVTVKAGILEEGDYLCSSDKAGYMEKQSDALLHNYTRGIAREKITEDTKTAYVYLQ